MPEFKKKNFSLGRKSKKILIATGIYPPDIGGPSRMVGALTEELIKNGFEVKIITYSKYEDIKNINDNVIRVKTGNKLRYFWEMLRLIFWADLIYATDLYSVGYFSYLYKKLLKKKYIIRFAGDSAWELAFNNGWIKEDTIYFEEKKYNKKIEKLKKRRRKIIVNADSVIAVSDFMKRLAIKIGAKKKSVKTIYNSVDFLEINNKIIKNEKEKIIVTSGRLVKIKSIDILINVLAELKEQYKFKLLIIGDGPERKRLVDLASKKGISDKVIFIGAVPQDNVFKYYSKANFFILNSIHESLPHALLEVLKLGKPVIAVNAGGNPEIIENRINGILVNYGDKKELKEAIREMMDNNKWNSNKQIQVCKNSIKKFSWEKNINKTIELINRI